MSTLNSKFHSKYRPCPLCEGICLSEWRDPRNPKDRPQFRCILCGGHKRVRTEVHSAWMILSNDHHHDICVFKILDTMEDLLTKDAAQLIAKYRADTYTQHGKEC